MINIFIDDKRHPKQVYKYSGDIRYSLLYWNICRNYEEFVKLIKNSNLSEINYISFDHDLADIHYKYGRELDDYEISRMIDYENTGYDCLKWMCDYYLDNNKKLPKILFHTTNSVGKENMTIYLKNFKKHNPDLI